MERIEELDNWIYHSIDNTSLECKNFCYYTRKMRSYKLYFSHVYFCVFDSVEDLCENWKKINYYVAVKYQTKVESVIEKSNFYICFFLEKKVKFQIKNEIEEDSFCAKKYVFEGIYESKEEYVKAIENKIFWIDVPPMDKKVPKFESIELQNFRGYAGNVKISFKDHNKKPASLVVLYAKNGVGKTSLFDGIEFALKGEVGRIQDLNGKEKEKMEGPIYHHREHKGEEAFVSIILSDKCEIRRKVSDVVENGNDCRVNVAKPGADIVGTKQDKDIWNQIILPHDKIDNFISAKSPVAQFKEWTESAAPLKTERMQFVESYEVLKKGNRELYDLDKRQQKLNKELVDIMQDKISVQKVLELLSSYNAIPGQSRCLGFDSEKAGVEEYDKLINQVKIYEREIRENILIKLNEKIQFGNEISSTGVSFYQKELDIIKQLEESIKKLDRNIKRKKERDRLINEEGNKKKLYEKTIKELEPLERIYSFGYKEVKAQFDNYQYLENKEQLLYNRIFVFSQEYEKILENYQSIQIKIEEFTNKYLNDYRLHEIHLNAEKYDSNQEILNKLERKCTIEKEKENQLEKAILSKKEELEKIKGIELSDNIEDIKNDDIFSVGSILGDMLQKELWELKELHNEQNNEAKIYQKQIEKFVQNKREINEIYKKGKEYLDLHKDEKKCPLCHTEFASWEALISSINFVSTENDEILKSELYAIQSKKKEISNKYSLFLQKFQKEKKEQIDELIQIVTETKALLKHSTQKQKDYSEQIDKIKHEIVSLRFWFIEQGIELDTFSSIAIKEWEKLQMGILNKYKEDMEEIQQDKDKITKKIEEKKQSLEEVKQQKIHISENEQLFANICFLRDQPSDFNYIQQLTRSRKETERYSDEINNLQAQIITYNDVVNVEEEECIKQKDNQLEQLERLNSIKAKSNWFLDFSEMGVANELNEWKNKEEEYKKQIEYLKQIEEESSARNYFSRYKNIVEELSAIKVECSNKNKEIEDAKQGFKIKKTTLEKRLKEYFNQNIMNEIYRKIDPHDFMKNVDYHLSFNAKDEPQLYIQVKEQLGEETDSYRPEWYFSTAQLNTVAFSSFFGRALSAQSLALRTIFIDDPISHFDDMNILGFADMIRSILETIDCQIIMSTHDEKIFGILERKLSDQYYSSCFIRLPVCEAVEWKRIPEI